MQPLVITIDGPAGSGKSSAARLLAQRLDLSVLNTGAMYRGVGLACLDAGIDPTDQPDGAVAVARRIRLDFDWSTDPPRLLIDGVDRSDRLRDPDVSAAASKVSALPPVRQLLVAQQQRIGREHPRLVAEGRDQGSVVFPDAPVKFFLDARADIRARRHAKDLEAAGKPVDFETLLATMSQRDHRDSTRKTSPLICPEGAIRIDTSEMTLDQVVDALQRITRQRVVTVAAGGDEDRAC